MPIDKKQVLVALRAQAAEQLRTLVASQGAAQSGATHEETRSEHPKDTRAIEAQYLARGLATRVAGLRETVAILGSLTPRPFGEDDPIGLTALVGVVDDSEQESVYVLVPSGGGEVVVVGGRTVQSLTPASPLGAALVGRVVGDELEVRLPRGKVPVTIAWVC